MKYPKNELFEKLAEIEHERWSDWQHHLHSKCANIAGSLVIRLEDVQHWERQIRTNYKDLSEKEKDSDREQVMRYWHLISKD